MSYSQLALCPAYPCPILVLSSFSCPFLVYSLHTSVLFPKYLCPIAYIPPPLSCHFSLSSLWSPGALLHFLIIFLVGRRWEEDKLLAGPWWALEATEAVVLSHPHHHLPSHPTPIPPPVPPTPFSLPPRPADISLRRWDHMPSGGLENEPVLLFVWWRHPDHVYCKL